jgi:hypothetical protein
MLLSREQILAAKDQEVKKISVPEWGGEVYIRPMSSRDRDKYEAEIIAMRSSGKIYENLRARLAVRSVCDSDGNLIFKDEDVELVGSKGAAALNRIFSAASKLNDFSSQDIKELEKN